MHCHGERQRKGTVVLCMLHCTWVFLPRKPVGAVYLQWLQSDSFACTSPGENAEVLL